jgi:hypothetical protein
MAKDPKDAQDEKVKLDELDDDEAIALNAELAKAQNASNHIHEQGVTAADRLDEGDLDESDEEALRG